MGDALIHEALANVVVRGCFRGGLAGNLGFLDLAVAAVSEQVVGIAGAHDAGAGEREGDARGVDGDPAAAPLLGDVRGGAGAAGGVEDEVAGVGGHQDAAFNNFIRSLDNINFPRYSRIVPIVSYYRCRKIHEITLEPNGSVTASQSVRFFESFHSRNIGFPIGSVKLAAFKINSKCSGFA